MPESSFDTRWLIAFCLLLTLASLCPAHGQNRLPTRRPTRTQIPSGLIETWPDATRRISCKARHSDPFLSFEFRFVAGYSVEIPVRELIGPANRILITVTVTPVSMEGQEPAQFQRLLETAEIPKGQKGRVEFKGSFALGEGRYDVRWELRDRFGRHCSKDWKVKTKLSKKDRDLELTLGPNEVAPSVVYLFRREEAIKGPAGKKLRVKLLVSMDVRRRRRVTVELWRYARLVSVLRVLSRHPSLVEFSVVAFSLEDQEVLFEQDYSGFIDFPRLGKTLKALSPGTVNFDDLGKNSEKQFLASLLESELCCDETADAFIFVGSDVRLGKKVPKQAIAPLRELPVPVFYLNSEPHPWRGMLGNAIKVLKGEQYKIRKPRHLSAAVAEIVSKTEPDDRSAEAKAVSSAQGVN